jgi:hypothetical protein
MKFPIIVILLFAVLTDFTNALAFTSHSTADTQKIASVASPSRRDVFGCMVVAGVTTTTTGVMASFVQPASASGGATAGGAYLLSAKQRYNQRVRAALQAFVNLQSAVEDGKWGDIESYFVTTEVGGWNDGSSAGYLLANAFRRNSSAAPDTLPAVKVSIIRHTNTLTNISCSH